MHQLRNGLPWILGRSKKRRVTQSMFPLGPTYMEVYVLRETYSALAW